MGGFLELRKFSPIVLFTGLLMLPDALLNIFILNILLNIVKDFGIHLEFSNKRGL